MPPDMGAQMRGMADMMRSNPAMAEQMRSMMSNMDPEQFKNMVRCQLEQTENKTACLPAP